MLAYGELEPVAPDVAPGADGVGDDGDGVVGHFAGGGVEGQGGWWCVRSAGCLAFWRWGWRDWKDGMRGRRVRGKAEM